MEFVSGNTSFTAPRSKQQAYAALQSISTQTFQNMNTTEILTQSQSAIDAMVCLWTHTDAPESIANLTTSFFPVLGVVPKMKIAKVLTNLFAAAESSGMSLEMQLELCTIMIEWSRREKRNFIRQRLQFRYVNLLFHAGQHQVALDRIEPLIREGTRLDDKLLITELYLMSSQCLYALHNFDKANGALMAARANSNNTYCEQTLQAKLDFHSGILALKSSERNTAYSFFCESFENYQKIDPARAQEALKFMLICKIGTSSRGEIVQSLSQRNVERYDTRVVEGIQLLTEAYMNHNTSEFQKTMKAYADILMGDPLSSEILHELYDTLVNLRLTQVIEPYSRVEIQHLADIMQLSVDEIEMKLSQLILDKRIHALIDQQRRSLVMKSDQQESAEVKVAVEILENLEGLVGHLIREYDGKATA